MLQMKFINKAFENKGLSVRANYCLVQLSAVDPLGQSSGVNWTQIQLIWLEPNPIIDVVLL